MGGKLTEDGEIQQHSGWLIPFAVAVAIALLCAALLLYYLRPFALGRNGTAPFRDSRDSAAAIPVTVGRQTFIIPRRYLEPGTRGGGDRVDLVAALPDMRGFTENDAELFAANAPDSPVVHLLIRGNRNAPDTNDRFQRIYLPYVTNPQGEKSAYGLTYYSFKPGSGYGGDDLYAGPTKDLLFLCERPAQDVPSPNCLTIDRSLAPGVNLSYRFKRSQLPNWRAIEDGVRRLIAKFRR
ncbi:MAG TPA: hypothetical protein VKB67_14255 [Rhizomicrobium sp.]|nr:hypothetical protein [Rhizomicrobium sp.]